MPSVLLQRTAMAIKTAGGWGAFSHHRCLICIIIHSYKTMLWSIKTKYELTICLLLCLELVHILKAAADDDGCLFGHHCCRQTSSNSIKHKVNKNILICTLIYQIKQNPLTAALERTCARPPAPRAVWYH